MNKNRVSSRARGKTRVKGRRKDSGSRRGNDNHKVNGKRKVHGPKVRGRDLKRPVNLANLAAKGKADVDVVAVVDAAVADW